MAQGIHRLNDRTVAGKSKPGMYADGGGLYLRVAPGGSKQWMFRYMADGVAHNMGLGPIHTVSLAEARELAANYRKLKHRGAADPIAVRAAEEAARREASLAAANVKAAPTFGAYAEEWIANKERRKWTDRTEGARWRSMLARYASSLGPMRLDAINTPTVIGVLISLWDTQNSLALKLRSRLAAIFKSAIIIGHHPGPNPAEWELIHHMLDIPKDAPQVENMAALPYHDVPAFIAELRGSNDQIVRSRALEFIILTGARIGEVLDSDRKQGMRWSTGEVNFDAKVWTVPKDRMKKKKLHPVPLSDRAIVILREMAELRVDDRVFPMSSSNVAKWITKRFNGAATTHGFRSSFRDWGAEAMLPSHLVEFSLAHYAFKEDGDTTDTKTAQAYRRTVQLENRRPIMQAWAEFCDGRAAAPVQKAA